MGATKEEIGDSLYWSRQRVHEEMRQVEKKLSMFYANMHAVTPKDICDQVEAETTALIKVWSKEICGKRELSVLLATMAMTGSALQDYLERYGKSDTPAAETPVKVTPGIIPFRKQIPGYG